LTTLINKKQKMKKKNISEGLYNLIKEMVVDEMARTAGTGGSYTITPEGEEMLKRAKATGQVPAGLNASKIAVLAFLYKAKQEGKRVQKIDYANERGVAQPAVNPLFNALEIEGLVSKSGYVSTRPGGGTSSRPGVDLSSILGDLDI
jgi:predicted transcriptional regulator